MRFVPAAYIDCIQQQQERPQQPVPVRLSYLLCCIASLRPVNLDLYYLQSAENAAANEALTWQSSFRNDSTGPDPYKGTATGYTKPYSCNWLLPSTAQSTTGPSLGFMLILAWTT